MPKPLNRSPLALVELESRITPIVYPAANLPQATPLLPGGWYDGVVSVSTPGEYGTGALIPRGNGSDQFGQYILTAAHVVEVKTPGPQQYTPQTTSSVEFELPLAGRTLTPAQQVWQSSRTAPVPAGVVQIPITALTLPFHPSYTDHALSGGSFWDFDIAILALVDQFDHSPSRLLVPPFGAPAYQPYRWVGAAANELGQTVTNVGYGRTGVGQTGATAPSGPLKRMGQNKIELDRWPHNAAYLLSSPSTLAADFDDGTPAHDAFGLRANKPDPGLGQDEALIAPGDSGGPWFVAGPSGGRYIGGVVSAVDEYNGAPNPDSAPGAISSFGDVAVATRVGPHYADFIIPRTSPAKYDLILDLNTQVYGLTNPNATSVDDLTITVERNATGMLVINVASSGANAKLDGLYYEADPSSIRSVVIRGTEDNETVIIKGPLGLASDTAPDGVVIIDTAGGDDHIVITGFGGPGTSNGIGTVTVEAGSGKNDTVVLDNGGSTAYNEYTLSHPAGSASGAVLLSRLNRPGIYVTGAEAYDLVTGSNTDIIRIEDTSTGAIRTSIYSYLGDDQVYVRLPGVTTPLFVSGGGQVGDDILLDDAAVSGGGTYALGSSAYAGWEMQLSRNAGGFNQPVSMRSFDKYELRTGNGVDTINIDKTDSFAALGTYVYANDSYDTVNVYLAGMGNRLFIDGGAGGLGEVVLNDSDTADPARYVLERPPIGLREDWELQLSRAVAGAPKPGVYLDNFSKYTLTTGSVQDQVWIDRTSSVANVGTFVNTRGGSDVVTVGSVADGLKNVFFTVTVDGGGQSLDVLNVDDRAGAPGGKYEVTPGRIRRNGGPDIVNTSKFIRHLYGADGNNRWHVLGNEAGTELAVFAGTGDDVVVVADEADALDGVAGTVTLDGQAAGEGRDRVEFSDRGFGDGSVYTLRGDEFVADRLPDLKIGFVGFEQVDVSTGAGADRIDLDGLAAGIQVAADGGGATDTVRVLSGEVYNPLLTALEKLDLIDGTLTLISAVPAFAEVRQSGGVLDGEATLTATQYLAWTGGVMQGTGTTATGLAAYALLDDGPLTLTRLLELTGTSRWTLAPIDGDDGVLRNTGTLYAAGTLVGRLENTGALFPGVGVGPYLLEGNDDNRVGTISVTGSFAHTGGTVTYDLASSSLPSDLISVDGVVTLGGAAAFHPLTPLTDNLYTLIDVTGLAASPTFLGLPEGTAVALSNRQFLATYVAPAAPGTDVALAASGGSGGSGGFVGDFVWHDVNGNNVHDPGEPGIAGVPISLTGPGVHEVAFTDAAGQYGFADLPAGTYVLDIGAPTGYAGPAPYYASGWSFTFDLAGQHRDDFDVWFVTAAGPGSIGDLVWADADQDGVHDFGEIGLAGVTVRLRDGNGNILDTTTSGAAGEYGFGDLAAGTYEIEVLPPVGGALTTPAVTTVVLGIGQAYTAADAGVYVEGDTHDGSIGDFVWGDADQDGTYDLGEIGLGGVEVTVTDAAGDVVGAATTSSSGHYTITGLAAGTYHVAFAPALGTLTTPASVTVTLAAGEAVSDADAGVYVGSGGSIGDFVWADADQDGIHDPGESGVGGVEVTLRDGSGATLASVSTDGTGHYLFTGLGAGAYLVEFVPPSGAVLTTPPAVPVTLAVGEEFAGADAGVHSSGGSGGSGGTIGDFVWADTDQDGSMGPGETGLAGVTVNLRTPAGVLLATTTSSSAGGYLFGGLAAGTYLIEFVPQAGAVLTTASPVSVILAAGAAHTTADAGVYASGGSGGSGGSIGDFVWADADQDGTFDAGEVGLGGVSVVLRDGSGVQLATTSTDASGHYLFPGLGAGAYLIDFVPPSGTTLTTASPVAVSLAVGEAYTGADAGVSSGGGSGGSGGSVGDFVWADTDEDGTFDAGEVGLGGVTVNLRDAAGAFLASTSTDASGHYLFPGLGAGTFLVEFVPPSGTTLTTASPVAVSLAAGAAFAGADAGVSASGGSGGSGGSIGDFVWADADQDGVFDPGEVGLGGVEVTLTGGPGRSVTSTYTDSSGHYRFGGLGAGTYSVEFIPGTIGSLTTPARVVVTLGVGQDYSAADAGVFSGSGGSGGSGGTAFVGDFVWDDRNRNGVHDPGEPGIAGVAVALYPIGGGAAIFGTVTDATGHYGFSHLPAGTYYLAMQPPTPYTGPPPSYPNGWLSDPFELGEGESRTDLDTYFIVPGGSGSGGSGGTTGVLGGTVWDDLNLNGVQDPGEPGIAGATVWLMLEAGGAIGWVTTDAAGNFQFTGLAAGVYIVGIGAPEGSGYHGPDPNSPTMWLLYSIVLTDGQVRDDIDVWFSDDI